MRQSEVAPVDQLRADRQRRCPVNVGPVALAVCVGITLFGCTSTDSQPAASTQPAPADPTTAPKAAPGSLSSDTPAAGTPTVVVPESIPVPRPQVREVARPAITLTNLATQGTATQSSTYRAGVAARANDGVTDGDWYHNSVSHTEDQPNSFWQVQLASPTTISRIVLFNRTDSNSERLANFRVSVLDRDEEVFGQDVAGPVPGRTRDTSAGRHGRADRSHPIEGSGNPVTRRSAGSGGRRV